MPPEMDAELKSECSELTSIALCTVQDLLETRDLEYHPDGKHIRWSASNKRHPRNWSSGRKLYDIGLVIFLEFFTTAISTAGSPAAEAARNDFGVDRTMAVFLFVSVYLLGQMLGGVVFPPYSEAFGRKKLYIVSTGIYSAACVLTGAVNLAAVVVIGRFLSGLVSSIPTIVVAGSIEDMFNSKDRTWLIFTWTVLANMGLTVGPIMSAYITTYLRWQYVFIFAAIVTGLTTCFLFMIRESRPSLLLEREVAYIRKESGDYTLKALNPDPTPDLRTFVHVGLCRPLKLFFTEPIVFMVAIMSAYASALIYLFTEALPLVYESMGFSATSSSLMFLAISIGLPLGAFMRIRDHRVIAQRKKQGLIPEPEDKIFGIVIAAPLLAGGLWLFTWTIPPAVTTVPWMVPTLALVFVGYAVNEFDTVLAGYLADSYLGFAASGFAALSILRSLMSAAFPMLAPKLFDGLGANGACMTLAISATIFCVIPPVFMYYGKKIRTRSEFAQFSAKAYHDAGVS